MSLPMRERGLKFKVVCLNARPSAVAPHAGAWIEISWSDHAPFYPEVAPHAGAWIEMVDIA